MSSPDERKAFYNQNLNTCRKLFRDEEASREGEGYPLMTAIEVDQCVELMMIHVEAGGVLDKYLFKKPEKKIQQKQAKQIEKTVEPKNTRTFNIVECDNGFILQQNSKSFIFSTKKELSSILNKLLFKEIACQKITSNKNLKSAQTLNKGSQPSKKVLKESVTIVPPLKTV